MINIEIMVSLAKALQEDFPDIDVKYGISDNVIIMNNIRIILSDKIIISTLADKNKNGRIYRYTIGTTGLIADPKTDVLKEVSEILNTKVFYSGE